MKVRAGNELVAINLIAILLIIVIAFVPSSVLRIILGLPLILFFPGYTLTIALFPRKNDFNNVERIALSSGLSIAVSLLIGLVLNYSPWGMGLYPIVVALVLFVFIVSVIAWYRRRSLTAEEVFSVRLNTDLLHWGAASRLNKVLALVLAALVLGVVGTLAYVIITPKTGEKFTEFYVLGLDGKAENYPQELVVGEEGKVILGIVNHEHEGSLAYRVEIKIGNEVNETIGPLTLPDEEEWQSEVSFTPYEIGDNQKAEFALYKQGDDEPYRSLYLWVDVKGTG